VLILLFALGLLVLIMLAVFVGLRLFDNQKVEMIGTALRSGSLPHKFKSTMIAGLPPIVQKYFVHSIALDTPLALSASLQIQGKLRISRKAKLLPVRANQSVGHRGYVWQGKLGKSPVWYNGNEIYAAGNCRVLWWLWGIVPLVIKHGDDVARSAVVRTVLERIWLPSTLLPAYGVKWEAMDDRTARATVDLDEKTIVLQMTFVSTGALESIQVERWGDLDNSKQYSEMTWVVNTLAAEKTVNGYTIPTQYTAGWKPHGKAWQIFYQPEVTSVEYL
jgi:Family of unknown function (DUF6544)